MTYDSLKGVEGIGSDPCAGTGQGPAEPERLPESFLEELERRNLCRKVAMARDLVTMGYSCDAAQRILHLPAGAWDLLEAGSTRGKE